MAEELVVQVRDETGKRRIRRLRNSGSVPAVLYGHGEENILLKLPAEQLYAAVRHGSRLIQLAGGVSDQALLKELQWNTFGSEILHVDLARVSADETIEVKVQFELRGEAPGTREGGVVELLLHEVDISCPASAIPEKLTVNINHLELDQTLTLADIELPPNVTVMIESDTPIVQCLEPAAVEELEEEVAGPEEPELIGRKEEGEDDDES